MADQSYPQNYQLFNNYSVKNLNVVVSIEGIDFDFGMVPTYTKIRYGDPDIFYGDPGLVYGGLRLLDDVKPWLMSESSLMLSQKLEPEQGRGSVSTLGLTFIDKDGYFTQLCARGVLLDELLGNKKVLVKLGYVQTSYPDDYFTVFRGYVSKCRLMAGKVSLELSDANMKRRQNIFFSNKTKLTAGINDSTLTIPVFDTERFFQQILGPDATYDSAISTFVQIEDEVIEYGPTGLAPTVITATLRGALGTTAVAHAIDSDVQAVVQIEDNVMDMALKLMLSGWNDFWLQNVSISSLGQTGDPDLGIIPNTFVIGVDALDEYGLAIGDYFTISGSVSGNNLSGRITAIGDANDFTNRLIYTDQTFTTESPALAVVVKFRSQFDTYPILCGLKLKSSDVDVAKHISIRDGFLSQSENSMRFVLNEQENGKDFIEKQLFVPIGLYSLTRFGRISAVITKPPIADERLTFINNTNILEPENISVERGLNMRRFFNEIQYNYDEFLLDKDNYSVVNVLLDTDSLNVFDQSSVLPIKARGLRSLLNAPILIDRRGNFLLSRYKDAAYEINLKVNWQAGTLIEAGDVVAIQDNGDLKIANLTTGERDLQTQLFEVIERNMDIKSGTVSLKLLSNIGYSVNDRFATISPSSVVGTGSTVDEIVLTPSFGQFFGSDEYKKYIDYIGLPVVVHDYAWTYSYEATIVGFDAVNPNIMMVSPSLGAAPIAGDIVDIGAYPNTTEPSDNQAYKTIHAFIDPTLTVVTGTSTTVFDVSLADAAKVTPGLPILIHNTDYSILSEEVNVLSVVGTTITLETPIAFTPAAGQLVELVGFIDGGGPYRII